MKKLILSLVFVIAMGTSFVHANTKEVKDIHILNADFKNKEITIPVNNLDLTVSLAGSRCFSAAVEVYTSALRQGYSREDAYTIADSFETICNALEVLSKALNS